MYFRVGNTETESPQELTVAFEHAVKQKIFLLHHPAKVRARGEDVMESVYE